MPVECCSVTRSEFSSRGLYAITDSALHTGEALEQAVTRAIAGGAKVIQYRDKSSEADRRYAEAAMLVRICRRRGVPMIVNDDIELALACEADGVHLGRDDADLSMARSRLGNAGIIGVSCYNSVDRADAAQRDGADYVAFGSMFSSATKPGATRAEVETIISARVRIHLPIVAIGGITPQNGASLLDAGVDLLAVVSGVFACDDPADSARQYARLFFRQARDEKI
jgi:thiamine-phosphate pyrophosphorylase